MKMISAADTRFSSVCEMGAARCGVLTSRRLKGNRCCLQSEIHEQPNCAQYSCRSVDDHQVVEEDDSEECHRAPDSFRVNCPRSRFSLIAGMVLVFVGLGLEVRTNCGSDLVRPTSQLPV